MKNYDELIAKLAQGASISRERNMNLDFAKVADKAATAIQELKAENAQLDDGWKDANRLAFNLQLERDEYRKAADDQAAAHKVERDDLRLVIDHAEIRENQLVKERDALSARLAALEQQEPTNAINASALFTAQHQFLEWNRQQSEPLVQVAYEYGVFGKAVELYLAAGAAPQPAQDVNAELVETAYDKVQQQIVERYRVEKSAGGFWPCCVKAGDGTRDIFVGSKKQAEHVRQALQTACLDGAFIATASKAAPQGEQQ
jgi:hypothetical protein